MEIITFFWLFFILVNIYLGLCYVIEKAIVRIYCRKTHEVSTSISIFMQVSLLENFNKNIFAIWEMKE